MTFEPTHHHRLNGLDVRLLGEERGLVTYEVPWSHEPRQRDSTSFHHLYEPIKKENPTP